VFVTANIHVKRMYMTGVNTGKCRAGETAWGRKNQPMEFLFYGISTVNKINY
jgi:hypothetical protein